MAFRCLAIVLVSLICWVPLIRGLTRSISQLTRATGRIAEGHFEIELATNRQDVADSGPSLPEAELDHVFKPFYRPEFARQRETGGVGLGLAIVRSCVEACGGTVRCRNRTPTGLEVEIQLPAAPAGSHGLA